MQSFRRSCWFLFVTVALSPSVAHAIDIEYQFDPSRHNRFLSGFGSNPVENPNILGMSGLDFSGVGWGSNDPTNPSGPVDWRSVNVAMVTPEHFIIATHNRPREGTALNFLGSDGVVRSYTIQNYIPLTYDGGGNTSDLMVGQLSAPIQAGDHIKIYSVVRPGPFQYPLANTPPEYLDYYRGKQMVVVGKNDLGGTDADGDGYNDLGGKIGMNTIDDIVEFNFGSTDSNTVGVGYFSPHNTPDVAKLVEGDSGSPSFLLYNGELTALGSHSGVDRDVDPQFNVDSLLPYYIDQINSLIAGSGFQLNVISPVPEPSTMALVGFAGAAMMFHRWRRRVIA